MPAEGALPGDASGALELIETLRWSPGEGFVRLGRHLQRMAGSAKVFEIPFREDEAVAVLERSVAGEQALRVCLVVDASGELACNTARFTADETWCFSVSTHRVRSGDPMLQHKTSRRHLFDEEQARAAAQGLHEVIFLNERGEITQGSRSNVFVRFGGRLVTPALHCGLLNGCLRRELIETGACTESVFFPSDLSGAEEILLGNSLRGLIRAAWSPSQE